MPKRDYIIEDDWHSVGLAGTGSKSIILRNVFVPEHRVLNTQLIGGGPSPGSAVNPHALYKIPPWSVGTKVFSGPALGIARGALEVIIEEMRARYSVCGVKMSDMPSVQVRIAEALAEIEAATALLLKDCDDAMKFGETGERAPIELRARWRLNNAFAGQLPFFALTSGSLTNAAGGLFETRDQHYWRMRGSIAYVSGSHHAKFGYDGGYYKQLETNQVNNSLLTFNYVSPAATAVCVNSTNPAVNPCGNLDPLQFPSDPFNFAKRPIPSTVNWSDGATTFDEKVRYDALYAQDQWTLKRLTASAALRFDHATSGYGSSCFGPNQFVTTAFCTSASDGVNYKDLTPRLGVAWDVQGNGKTAVKWR